MILHCFSVLQLSRLSRWVWDQSHWDEIQSEAQHICKIYTLFVLILLGQRVRPFGMCKPPRRAHLITGPENYIRILLTGLKMKSKSGPIQRDYVGT